MSPQRRAAKHPQWTSLEPAEMTLDQLAAASTVVRAQMDYYQTIVSNLNTAWLRIQSQVNSQFATALPGVPPVETISPWPADFMKSYDWSTGMDNPDTTDTE